MEDAITADGRWAISMADSTKHRIESITLNDQGRGHRTMFGSFGGGPGQFSSPQGIAVDTRRRIWVVDTGNHRVQVFAALPGFPFLFTFGRHGTGAGEFDTPTGIAIDGLGNVFVVDSGNSRVQVFDQDGGHIGSTDRPGSTYLRPVDVAITHDHVLVVDAGDRQVKQFTNPFRHQTPC